MADDRPQAPGDPCRRCAAPVEQREGMFYFRGRSFPGLYCAACRALYPFPTDNIFDAAREAYRAEHGGERG
jgi:hypothetical protein